MIFLEFLIMMIIYLPRSNFNLILSPNPSPEENMLARKIQINTITRPAGGQKIYYRLMKYGLIHLRTLREPDTRLAAPVTTTVRMFIVKAVIDRFEGDFAVVLVGDKEIGRNTLFSAT